MFFAMKNTRCCNSSCGGKFPWTMCRNDISLPPVHEWRKRNIFVLSWKGDSMQGETEPVGKIYFTFNRFNASLAEAFPCSAALRYQLTACA